MTAKKVAPTRERLLKAAKHLFQQRGYHGVGTAEILTAANAPKGSMYHHFPEGKEQMAVAVVQSIQADIAMMIEALTAKKTTTSEIIRHLARGMGAWLKKSQWREGTLLASTAIGSVPDLPKLHAAIKAAFDDWRGHLTKLLINEGWSRTNARTMAQSIIAATEGAMMVARVDQDEHVVTKVAELLAQWVEAGDSTDHRHSR